MSTVFFLFLLHLSLGLLAALPLVPARAGARFFKFCSGSSAVMTALGLALLARRHGPAAAAAAVGEGTIAAAAAFLLLTVLYNRAEHFGWRRPRGALLGGAVAAGVAAVVLGAPAERSGMVAAADLTSALLLGAAAAAMILGHWYLVVLDLPIAALRRLTLLLIAALALRSLVVGLVLAGPVEAGLAEAGRVAAGLWSADGVFIWMRLLFGIAGPLSLLWFVWKTVEIRSTQSATGILYVQLFLVLSGELLATYLRVAAGLPL